MKRASPSPTKMQRNESSSSSFIKERVVRLSEAVNELRMEIQQEHEHQDQIEKASSKHYNLLSTQIKALRKAFNTLADVTFINVKVMEELDNIKTDLFTEFQDTNTGINKRIDDLNAQMYQIHNSRQDEKLARLTLEQDVKERLRMIDEKCDEQQVFVQTVLENSKQDNRALFDKLKAAVNSNTNLIEQMTLENEKAHENLIELEKKINIVGAGVNDTHKRMNELEENTQILIQEVQARINESRNHVNALKEAVRIDSQNSLNLCAENQQKIKELEKSVAGMHKEFQVNLQELASMHKQTSTGMITDFEKAIATISGEKKVILKKLSHLETGFKQLSEDLAGLFSEQDQEFNRKYNALYKAISHICKQLKLKNPFGSP